VVSVGGPHVYVGVVVWSASCFCCCGPLALLLLLPPLGGGLRCPIHVPGRGGGDRSFIARHGGGGYCARSRLGGGILPCGSLCSGAGGDSGRPGVGHSEAPANAWKVWQAQGCRAPCDQQGAALVRPTRPVSSPLLRSWPGPACVRPPSLPVPDLRFRIAACSATAPAHAIAWRQRLQSHSARQLRLAAIRGGPKPRTGQDPEWWSAIPNDVRPP
jgi:hypothetical protein